MGVNSKYTCSLEANQALDPPSVRRAGRARVQCGKASAFEVLLQVC